MNYGCIGEHLGHSFSRDIHALLDTYEYTLQELSPQELPSFLKAREFCGINVTIPYKGDVIPFIDELSETARAIGAVNTIVNRGGKLFGYNTDFGGMKALILRLGLSFSGAKVLVLGTGGTSRTAVAVATHLGAREVITVSRTGNRGAITYEEATTNHTDADYIINTTPAGMFPNVEGCPVDIQHFPHLSGVVDAVYHPLRTRLVRAAKARGIPAEGGLYMLVMQAVLAWELFTGKTCSAETAEKVYRQVLSARQNVVLVGMPGSGKTTVGQELARRLSRPLIDTDAVVTKTTGTDIPTLFQTEGEIAFRNYETAAVKETAVKTGIVIATGGGAVLRSENIDALRGNGKIFFLNRPLADLLPTKDRPLASSVEAIRQRFSEREHLYRAAADCIISADTSVSEVAAAIERELL